jgi:hypothetical protein
MSRSVDAQLKVEPKLVAGTVSNVRDDVLPVEPDHLTGVDAARGRRNERDAARRQ